MSSNHQPSFSNDQLVLGRYDHGASAVERRRGPGHDAMVCVLADRRILPRIVSFRYAVRMEWSYNSLSEADDTKGIARSTLMRWIRAGQVTATRRGRGPHGGRPTWRIAHSEIAAAAADLGWWESLPDPGSARNRHGNRRRSLRFKGGVTSSGAAALTC